MNSQWDIKWGISPCGTGIGADQPALGQVPPAGGFYWARDVLGGAGEREDWEGEVGVSEYF